MAFREGRLSRQRYFLGRLVDDTGSRWTVLAAGYYRSEIPSSLLCTASRVSRWISAAEGGSV